MAGRFGFGPTCASHGVNGAFAQANLTSKTSDEIAIRRPATS
jgi:hypothetical protein